MPDTDQFDYKGAIRDIEKHIAALQPPKLVLLVEDNPLDIELGQRVLDKFNVKVVVAETADTAVELVKTHTFDIIMFDLVMPQGDGLSFLMRSTGLQPGAHFILITGYPTSDKVDAVLKKGAVMLPKPLTVQSLEMFLPKKLDTA